MSDRLQSYIAFWESLADLVKQGTNVPDALAKAKTKAKGTELEEVAAILMVDLRAGEDLSQAMGRHRSVFSRGVRMMVRAGEAGGVLDVIMERIAEGLKDGSFPIPGEKKGEPSTARFFRAFARLLSSGVPIANVLEILAEEVATGALVEASGALRQDILEGLSVAEAMEKFPELFASRVRAAIAEGEIEGGLDGAAFRVADALEAGDLTSLPAAPARAPGEPQDIEKDEGAHPVVKVVNLIVLEAIKARATDIHIEPTADERGRVRQRVDGAMQTLRPFPERMYGAVVARIKILARLDIAERRKPQDGRFDIKVGGTEYALRVNVLPTTLGEAVVIRILSAERTVLGLDQIGFGRDELEKVRALCRLDQGMVIVTGPTASGSTTLLLAMLKEIDREKKCVVTVEDPVEVRIEGVEQVRVDSRIGVTFPAALRSILRHDPDVVMASHMRDLETVEVALHAALSGRLILTMLYTSSPPATVRRLLDLGLEPFQINSGLAAVISQRLVRKLCPECKVEAEVSEDRMPKEAVEFIKGRKGARVYAPKGCEACRGGYSGRTAIHEMLIPDDDFRGATTRSADTAALRSSALASGMKPMFIRGLELAVEGVTSVEEVCRVAYPP